MSGARATLEGEMTSENAFNPTVILSAAKDLQFARHVSLTGILVSREDLPPTGLTADGTVLRVHPGEQIADALRGGYQ
jgi:hypothetical protein